MKHTKKQKQDLQDYLNELEKESEQIEYQQEIVKDKIRLVNKYINQLRYEAMKNDIYLSNIVTDLEDCILYFEN
jgi:hypothetical protein